MSNLVGVARFENNLHQVLALLHDRFNLTSDYGISSPNLSLEDIVLMGTP
jgi:hypothetical protein